MNDNEVYTNCFVLNGNKINSNVIYNKFNNYVIDSSSAVQKIADYDLVKDVLLTHTHPDHVNYKNMQGKKVYTTGYGKESLLNLKSHDLEMLIDNLGIMQGIRGSLIYNLGVKIAAKYNAWKNKKIINTMDINELKNGDKIKGLTANLVGGHSKDSIVYTETIEGKKIGYVGDTAYRDLNNISIKTWQDSSFSDSIKALDKIISLSLDMVVLSHNAMIDKKDSSIIQGKEKIKDLYENIKKEALEEREEVLKLFCNNKTLTLKKIRDARYEATQKRCYYSGSSDFGYGFTYSIIKEEILGGRIKHKGKKLIKV